MSEISHEALDWLESVIDRKIQNALLKVGGNQYKGRVLSVDKEGVVWVEVPGVADKLPADISLVEVVNDDIVQVRIDNGAAIVDGNQSSPSVNRVVVESVANGIVAPISVEMENVKANQATFEFLQAQRAEIVNATIQELKAGKADIDFANITWANIDQAFINALSSNYAHIVNGTIDTATIGYASVNGLDTHYAAIDAANITELINQRAWLDQIMVQTGMITSQGNIFYLDAIQVNASSITAGTIDVQRLVVTDPDTGDKHLVEWDSVTEEWVSTKLDGDVIQDLTITADKIVAGAITADKITTQNIVGSGGWINLRNGTFQYVNANSGQGISWDGTNLHISGSVTVGGLPMDISEVAGVAMDTLIYDTTYVYDNQDPHEEVTFTAYLYRGGVDIKESYPENCFTWWLKSEDWHQNDPMIPLTSNGDYTCTLTLEDVGYGATVVGRFEPPNDAIALDDDDNTLVDDDDVPISVRTPTGDYVRVSELEVETTIFDADKMLLVTSEGEKLATIATLKTVFGTGDYELLDNKPSIEGVTLIDDKSFPDLGIFKTDQQGYDVPDDYTLSTMDINALWANAVPIGG